MAEKKKLPIGIEAFKEFQTDNFYYVDKTGFISELMQIRGKVNLFTRPMECAFCNRLSDGCGRDS